jgi:hypothetical protein
MVFVDPTVTEDGLHDTAVLVLLGVGVSEKVPEEDGLCLSPAYLAVITTTMVEVGVYLTEQVPLESLHAREESFPEPVWDQVTLPVGRDPVTDAEHVVVVPTTGDGLAQVTVTEFVAVMGSAGTTVILKVPLLPPAYVASSVVWPIDEPVTVIWHSPDEERVQELDDRVTPPEPVWDQVTLPVGRDPATVAEQVVEDPTAGDELLQVTTTEAMLVAGLAGVTTRLKNSLLQRWSESPL